MYDTISACSFGPISTSAATITATDTFASSVYANQGAYNAADNCYYVFKTYMGGPESASILYKIDAAGAVTAFSGPSGASYSGLAYNRVSAQLCCYTNGHIATVTTSGSSFAVSNIATPLHPYFISVSSLSLTVDNATGDIYYVTGDTAQYYVEKYHAGASAPVVAASGTGAWAILGLRYNTNDNMLYGIRQNTMGYTFDFIKVSPASGTVSTIAPMPVSVNPEFYSACIDPCANHYIISTPLNLGTAPFVLQQLSMSGAVLQSDSTGALFQGLDVNF
jgi:hypothetical protein